MRLEILTDALLSTSWLLNGVRVTRPASPKPVRFGFMARGVVGKGARMGMASGEDV
jgi:hypothetical protein